MDSNGGTPPSAAPGLVPPVVLGEMAVFDPATVRSVALARKKPGVDLFESLEGVNTSLLGPNRAGSGVDGGATTLAFSGSPAGGDDAPGGSSSGMPPLGPSPSALAAGESAQNPTGSASHLIHHSQLHGGTGAGSMIFGGFSTKIGVTASALSNVASRNESYVSLPSYDDSSLATGLGRRTSREAASLGMLMDGGAATPPTGGHRSSQHGHHHQPSPAASSRSHLPTASSPSSQSLLPPSPKGGGGPPPLSSNSAHHQQQQQQRSSPSFHHQVAGGSSSTTGSPGAAPPSYAASTMPSPPMRSGASPPAAVAPGSGSQQQHVFYATNTAAAAPGPPPSQLFMLQPASSSPHPGAAVPQFVSFPAPIGSPLPHHLAPPPGTAWPSPDSAGGRPPLVFLPPTAVPPGHAVPQYVVGGAPPPLPPHHIMMPPGVVAQPAPGIPVLDVTGRVIGFMQ